MGLAWYLAKKGMFLSITLVLAIFTTVLIANGGGKLDEVLKAQIKNEIVQQCNNDPACRNLDAQTRNERFNQTYALRIRARGLDEPFLQRTLRLTRDSLLLDLGRASGLKAASGSQEVSDIIGERLVRTVILFTAANIVAAVVGIWLGLRMARHALSPFDRGMTVLSITTFVVPPWVYGIFFILLFGFRLHWFPTGGVSSVPAPPEGTPDYYLDQGYHMLLPMFAVAFSIFGSWAYTTRNLVLQIMDEDFVRVARAKGLPEKTVLNRYVLRAASPPIVTSLALTLVAAWTGAIITETVFNYRGLGLLFFEAVVAFDAPVVVGLTAIYAELLVLTVFLLEVVYSFLDPRIRALKR